MEPQITPIMSAEYNDVETVMAELIMQGLDAFIENGMLVVRK